MPLKKHKLRAIFRATAFLALIAVISVLNGTAKDDISDLTNRRLEEVEESNMNGIFQKVAEPAWLMAPYIIGVLYMFLALAIVCDEYFVPALECMSSENHLNLTPDISGATLMAAGGSAPELFTSFIGTFQESEVGFGTIVGSAVFNVLFVIGMCSLLSTSVLDLTWWPLFRDSTYYAIGLLVLAIFIGVKGPGEIDLVEALILFIMYFGYIILMAFNERLYKMITGKDLYPVEAEVEESSRGLINLKRPTVFRAGLLTLIRDPDVWLEKAKISFVSKISGNVDDVFDFVDVDGDGTITREELAIALQKIEEEKASEKDVEEIMNDIDGDKNGTVSKKEFRAWYVKSEEHIKKQLKTIFERFDFDDSGGIQPLEFTSMLKEIEPDVLDSEVEIAIKECFSTSSKAELSFDDFTEWYFKSVWYTQHKKVADDDVAKSIGENLAPPKDATIFGFIKYVFLFPIVATLTLTIPDVRRPGMIKGPWCYLAFLISICWIGIYSYFMVGWAETIGNTLGIDTFIMGLTFLAAGTSVPDLLSSVIVARMGEGDMAVSSSIGSNIFDILVGLPFPWLIYNLWPNKGPVTIGAEGVWLNIMILLGMLVLIILSIHFSGWKLSKMLGFTMFVFYFLFLLQAIIRYVVGGSDKV